MDQHARILVVEDDAALSDIVCTFLTQEGYACVPAFSGTEALMVVRGAAGQAVQDVRPAVLPGAGSAAVPGETAAGACALSANAPFDLVICDLMLPGIPGERLIGELRTLMGDVPIVVTSAKGAVADRVGVLRLGANDYLVKPFDLDELLARVEVQLRGRTGQAPAPASTTLRFGVWELDLDARTFTAAAEPVRLTRTEFDILATLMAAPDRVFTKKELFEAVRHEEALLDERTVSTHVGNLRAKLKASGTSDYIQTVWGIGFKLCLR